MGASRKPINGKSLDRGASSLANMTRTECTLARARWPVRPKSHTHWSPITYRARQSPPGVPRLLLVLFILIVTDTNESPC